MTNTVIAGVGIHPFGRFPAGYRELGRHAVNDCLRDAGVAPAEIDITFVANVGAEMAKGHNILDAIHRGGQPIINVEAACASSGSALFMANNMVASGAADIVLCVGVEKAPRGFIARSGFEQWQIDSGLGVNPLYFAIQAHELLDGGGVTIDDLADVAVKNHRHSVHNPNAMYRREFTREQVLDSKPVCVPLTLLMLCAPNEGAAAAILMSEDTARRRGIENPVRLRSIGLVSRGPDDWFVPAPSYPVERTSITARAAAQAYEAASLEPTDIDVVECQDTDVASELLAYRDLGLCKAGDEAALIRNGDTALGGRLPVNPSGGLLSKGEPLGASGLGQIHELVQQLRGRAGLRQVDQPRVGVSHVMGAGHNACVTVLTR